MGFILSKLIVEETIKSLSGSSVPELIVKFLQAPLVGGFQSLPGILLYVLLSTFVFVLGIHGAYVFGAISGPVLLTSLQQNIDAIQAGHTAPNIVTQPFLDAYVYMGGGGTMICLVIALFIFSKRKDERTMAEINWRVRKKPKVYQKQNLKNKPFYVELILIVLKQISVHKLKQSKSLMKKREKM